MDDVCSVAHFQDPGLHCMRPSGHGGPHVCRGAGDRVVYWSARPRLPSPSVGGARKGTPERHERESEQDPGQGSHDADADQTRRQSWRRARWG